MTSVQTWHQNNNLVLTIHAKTTWDGRWNVPWRVSSVSVCLARAHILEKCSNNNNKRVTTTKQQQQSQQSPTDWHVNRDRLISRTVCFFLVMWSCNCSWNCSFSLPPFLFLLHAHMLLSGISFFFSSRAVCRCAAHLEFSERSCKLHKKKEPACCWSVTCCGTWMEETLKNNVKQAVTATQTSRPLF